MLDKYGNEAIMRHVNGGQQPQRRPMVPKYLNVVVRPWHKSHKPCFDTLVFCVTNVHRAPRRFTW
jgi:hypothetical protein